MVQRVLKNDRGSRKQANVQYEASTFQLIQLLKGKNPTRGWISLNRYLNTEKRS